MTGTRTSFTCDTINDLDIIDWLDSFGSRERGFAIKAAIRSYMMGETNSSSTSLEERLVEILREVVATRKAHERTNEQLLALSINNDIINPINKDLSDQELLGGEIDSEVMENIGNLFNED